MAAMIFSTWPLLFFLGSAWLLNIPRIDLIWPPVQAEREIPITNSNEAADSTYPCAHVPIPDNVERIDFPIIGGQLQFNFSTPSPGQRNGRELGWGMSYALGQFNGNQTVGQDNWFMIRYKYWNATNFNANIGIYCTPEFDDLGNYAINLTKEAYESPLERTLPEDVDLEGMNATLAVELFRLNNADLDAGMDQCVYVRLTSNPRSWGACAESDLVSPTVIPTPTSSGFGGGGIMPPTFTPTPSHPTGAPTHSRRNSSLVIGASVGAVAGAALIALIVGFFIVRRRRQTRQLKNPVPMPPDSEDKDLKKMKNGGKWKGKEVDAGMDGNEKRLAKEKESDRGKDAKDTDSVSGESSSASVHSEVPPSYADAVMSEIKL